jgi:hypothetical protein
MKTLIRKSVIAATLLFTIAASSFKANAQDDKLVYQRKINTSIGITVANATGADYTIKDKKGNVVHRGKVKSAKTFYIPTGKLGTGTFCFCIGNLLIQEFEVK